ncbi:MAG: hypothetical protein LBM39_00205 [Candidatus Methanoplasma sp.]|nr:hypothetical protein [Candidatus Methanoplasma sp.]
MAVVTHFYAYRIQNKADSKGSDEAIKYAHSALNISIVLINVAVLALSLITALLM